MASLEAESFNGLCYNQHITKAMSLLNALTMKITNGRAILIAEGNDEYHSQRWWNSKYYSNGLLLVHGKVNGITNGIANGIADGIPKA